tara:strand:+ start:474 stop:698 length:225 start_codon:yes stop_codon:yes gene_type:complete
MKPITKVNLEKKIQRLQDPEEIHIRTRLRQLEKLLEDEKSKDRLVYGDQDFKRHLVENIEELKDDLWFTIGVEV